MVFIRSLLDSRQRLNKLDQFLLKPHALVLQLLQVQLHLYRRCPLFKVDLLPLPSDAEVDLLHVLLLRFAGSFRLGRCLKC